MDEYDYIICGGGTSGCVVAARLAEEDSAHRILLIEAGAHNQDLENVHMVGGYSRNFGTSQDWNLVTVPQQHANNREIPLSRGRFLGGSSGLNGTLCIRGSKQDFDDWHLSGWSGEEVFAAMRKAETFHGKDWFQPAPGLHGTDGPIHTEPHDLAPISKLMLESFQSKGFPLDHDMFTHGELPHGCGHAVRTHYRGWRSTGADYLTKDRKRDNIDMLFDSHVDKVNISSESDGLRATSVDVIAADGTRQTFQARKEIIISGGSYCTPPILMRSGIGPAEELTKHDIQCLVDAPGVGQNLSDHLIVLVHYELSQPGLSNDDKAFHSGAAIKSYKQYQTDRTGFLSTFPFGAFAFARLDDHLKDDEIWKQASPLAPPGRDPMGLTPQQPHIEYFSVECFAGAQEHRPIHGAHTFTMMVELFSPQSRGSITLASKDPHAKPVIDCNYLADPLDLHVLAAGVQLGNEVVLQGAGTKDVVKGWWPAQSPHHLNSTIAEWIPYVQQHATTCYHPAGTAKMGLASDPAAVVDERLRVRGVRGLRVADCSVMPSLHGGHTQMVAYAVGERCADFIREGEGREQ